MASIKQDVQSAFGILWLAARRSAQGWKVLLPLCLVIGGLSHVVMWQVATWVTATYVPPGMILTNKQIPLVVHMMTETGVEILIGALLYPIIDASTIYIWHKLSQGQAAPGLVASVNWALNRWRRMFLPHLAVTLTIQIGMTVIVPGILFGLMYAFVDPITATDAKATKPLARSQKFTRGRRRRIALMCVPYAILTLPLQLGALFAIEALGWWAVMLFGTVLLYLFQILEMGLYGLYEERIEDARRALEAREAARTADG